jgi:hypothetical protein
MPAEPVSPDPERDDDPARDPGEPGAAAEDWLTREEWIAWLDSLEPDDEDDPGEDPDDVPAQPHAAARPRSAGRPRSAAGAAGGARAARGGRRGPGQPGSARRSADDSPGPAGAFATGHLLDTGPGGAALFGFAENIAGDDDRFGGACDDELTGVICALDRAEASAAALKCAAVAELIRRRPGPGAEPVLAGPGGWEEFTGSELAWALADTRWAADTMLDLAAALAVKLPGTRAAFRSGVLRQSKVEIIARAVAHLTPEEARAAEAKVLDRAGRLTPGGLRAAINRAVIEVAPDKAAKRREQGERDARVERWPEHSGNAGLAGRELPPADVLAADQRITWWAKKLREAGLDGDMDQLRARAYLDIILGRDSTLLAQPEPPATTGSTDGTDRTGRGPGDSGPGDGGPGDGGPGGGSGRPGPDGTQMPPVPGVIPAGFAGCINLTVTVPTLLDLAGRPGELSGTGPIDPALARDLADAAARNPKTTYCVTVTDEQGHAIGHGCARPEPKNRTRTTGPPQPPPPAGHDPPAGHSPPGGHDPPGHDPPGHDPPGHDPPPGRPGPGHRPGFTFTASGEDGPPGGYGTWRLSTGLPGRPDLLIALDPIATDTCDHRFQARGHDPGVKLKHLTQIRHATCTGPTCRRPAQQCDFEHNIPYEAGGATCMCNGGPKCRHEHRIKQHPRWNVEQITPATFRWTVPSGRQYTTEATRYPT